MEEPPAHLLDPQVLVDDRYIQSCASGKAVACEDDLEEHLQELQGRRITEVFAGAAGTVII